MNIIEEKRNCNLTTADTQTKFKTASPFGYGYTNARKYAVATHEIVEDIFGHGYKKHINFVSMR